MPATRFWVYCTTSLNKNAYADAETSAPRVLFKFRSYIVDVATAARGVCPRLVVPLPLDTVVDREKRELVADWAVAGAEKSSEEVELVENIEALELYAIPDNL